MFFPGKNGVKYDHLKQAASSGAVIPELEAPKIPEEAFYLWNLWTEIQNERDSSFSIQPLKVRDIIGYAGAFGFKLVPFEIEAIQAIDREFIKVHGHSKP